MLLCLWRHQTCCRNPTDLGGGTWIGGKGLDIEVNSEIYYFIRTDQKFIKQVVSLSVLTQAAACLLKCHTYIYIYIYIEREGYIYIYIYIYIMVGGLASRGYELRLPPGLPGHYIYIYIYI